MTIGIRLLQISLAVPGLAPDTRGWLEAEKIECVGDLYELVTNKKRWPCGNVIGADKIAIEEYIDLNRKTIEAVTEPTKERAEEKPQKIKPKMSQEEWDKTRLSRLDELDELADKVIKATTEYEDAKEKAKDKKKKLEKLEEDHFALSRQISSPQARMDFTADPVKPAVDPADSNKTPLSAVCDDAAIVKLLKKHKLETIGGLLMWVESVRKSGGLELNLDGIKPDKLISIIAAAEQYGKVVAAKPAVVKAAKAEKTHSKHIKLLRIPAGTALKAGSVLEVIQWRGDAPFVSCDGTAVILEPGCFEEVAAA